MLIKIIIVIAIYVVLVFATFVATTYINGYFFRDEENFHPENFGGESHDGFPIIIAAVAFPIFIPLAIIFLCGDFIWFGIEKFSFKKKIIEISRFITGTTDTRIQCESCCKKGDLKRNEVTAEAVKEIGWVIKEYKREDGSTFLSQDYFCKSCKNYSINTSESYSRCSVCKQHHIKNTNRFANDRDFDVVMCQDCMADIMIEIKKIEDACLE